MPFNRLSLFPDGQLDLERDIMHPTGWRGGAARIACYLPNVGFMSQISHRSLVAGTAGFSGEHFHPNLSAQNSNLARPSGGNVCGHNCIKLHKNYTRRPCCRVHSGTPRGDEPKAKSAGTKKATKIKWNVPEQKRVTGRLSWKFLEIPGNLEEARTLNTN